MTTLDQIRARVAEEPTLPADARMNAYYYGFDRTGVDEIDSILSTVAIAGKGSHHTESWSNGDGEWYYSGREGLPDADGAIDLIEKTAKVMATRVKAMHEDRETLLAAIDAVHALHVRVEFDDFTVCGYCEMRYPCATVTTITEALGDTK